MLLHVALFMQLGTVPIDPPSIELELRRREVALLRLALDRSALRSLSVWDPQTDALRVARPGEISDDNTPIMILHLWATWCVVCKEEFPIWGAMAQHLTARHKGNVRILHVALQNESSDMAAFVRQLHDKLPFPVKFFDRSELLLARLRQAFDSNQPPLPLTLVLDSQRVTRQAFLGPIQDRRQELIDSTARLMRLFREQQNDALKRAQPSALAAEPKAALPTDLVGPPRAASGYAAELISPPKFNLQREEDPPKRVPLPVGGSEATGVQKTLPKVLKPFQTVD